MAYDEDFYTEVIRKKADFESLRRGNALEDENTIMQEFNDDIRYDEVSYAVDSSKCKKAYLNIPNEAMKNKSAKLLLHSFFNICFRSGYNPIDWDFSDIVPIPKKDKDPRDPLQNRCITIVSCVVA